MFTAKDIEYIKKKGIKEELVHKQIEQFKNGFPYVNIMRPASIGDGILQLSNELAREFAIRYMASEIDKIVKFVPASGAASRMFKGLFEIYYALTEGKQLDDKQEKQLNLFVTRLEDFSFYLDLKKCIEKSGQRTDELLSKKKYSEILKYLLFEEGLNYGGNPKGLLAFHTYESISKTPFEEHLTEAAEYAVSSGQKAYIHFTVSAEHKQDFMRLYENVKHEFEQKYKLAVHIDFSEQEASTDTLAVDMQNRPFRKENGELLFRPGGHGALIENLNHIDADVIFVKNIDNIVPDHFRAKGNFFKQVIGGVLISYRDKIYDYLKQLEMPVDNIHETFLDEILGFIKTELCVVPRTDVTEMVKEQKLVFALEVLNRPLRVCGMVKNEGEPGGGPFWVRSKQNTTSLQIVETSQINLNDSQQKEHLSNATHFNPVDLVCAVKDYKGEKFDLTNFIDEDAGFISEKSFEGRRLKALELPGLWNGAMANWNTVFVEVPIETFNPVKTVFDLLRKEHQAE